VAGATDTNCNFKHNIYLSLCKSLVFQFQMIIRPTYSPSEEETRAHGRLP
jgi:hypothetical protein